MEVAAGAMAPLLRKLGELLLDEYNLKKRVKKGVKSLLTELEMMHAVLRKVGNIPPDQLDEQVRIWAGKVRELSYAMEDDVDAFLVRVEVDRHDLGPIGMKNRFKKFVKKATKLLHKGKALHQISDAIEEARELAKELGELRQRYMLEAHANIDDTIDPRLKAVYKDVTELVGIDHTRDELIKMMYDGDKGSRQLLKIISIVGFGGLGKTTLAKAVYDKIRLQFDCAAFISVSRSPDVKKIFRKMLYELDKNEYAHINEAVRDVEQLLHEVTNFLHDKRYIIVIDDIWDEDTWGFISCAFSKSSLGSRVITTTRIGSISEACCYSNNDIIYKMTPLTDDNSKRLFYKRIFFRGRGCPQELEQVSREILKKCGGVPLAIITIASLLASSGQQIKPKYQWENLARSIGRGLAEGSSVKDMQKIISFSYYDLPSHLKTCLLYLSIFPEDYEIRRDRLIWRWVAEGFVQCGKQESKSLFELGVSYFNELINRSMIQAIEVNVLGSAKACRVHDMVLDLICSLSSEENFVTVLDGTEGRTPNPRIKVRRLSFQNSMSEFTNPLVDTASMSQVRSITLYKADVGLIRSLSCFQVLRVLDLEGCYFRNRSHSTINLRCVESLLHLRYLGLKDTCAGELPIEIGKLRFLQTLDLRGSRSAVPSSVVQLGHLMCLYIGGHMIMPVGMGNLVSLEQLTGLRVDGSDATATELGQLIKLRALGLLWHGGDENICNSLVLSLGNLRKLQSLMIGGEGDTTFNVSWHSLVPPPQLCTLVLCCCTSTMPRWINSTSLPLLCRLCIVLEEVSMEDIQILGTLPSLCSLRLESTEAQYTCVGRFTDMGAHALFPSLKVCIFRNFTTAPSMFPQGAMPRLEFLEFYARALDIASGDLGVGMAHLPSLQVLKVALWRDKDKSLWVKNARAALRLSAHAHPNRPTIDIKDYITESIFNKLGRIRRRILGRLLTWSDLEDELPVY